MHDTQSVWVALLLLLLFCFTARCGAGREFECDFGFVGEGGICVDFVDDTDPFAPVPGACGGGGQPVCSGDDLAGAHLTHESNRNNILST